VNGRPQSIIHGHLPDSISASESVWELKVRFEGPRGPQTAASATYSGCQCCQIGQLQVVQDPLSLCGTQSVRLAMTRCNVPATLTITRIRIHLSASKSGCKPSVDQVQTEKAKG
jgi:hypothetical protein